MKMRLLINNANYQGEYFLFFVIIILLANCKPTLKNELQNYNVIYIVVYDTIYVNKDSVLASDIKQQLITARQVNTAYKGIGIGIVLTSALDTMYLINYSRSNILRYNNKFYKTDNVVLPDSIRDQLLKIYDN